MATNNCESITFEVEKGLKIEDYSGLYRTYSIKEIFSRLFKKNKITERKILHYNFDTEETLFYNKMDKSLIHGLITAYRNHYPITVTPDMIWILFLQGYSRFMEKYSELVRDQYVNFKDKKELVVMRLGFFADTATTEEWGSIISEFTENIDKNVGKNVVSNLLCNFSTTTPTTLTTSHLSIMTSMKQYFTYVAMGGGCGISSITLEGTLEDWEKIKSKLEFFSKEEWALNWWIKHLMPIIDKIILTKKYYDQNKKITEDIRKFWKDMIRVKFGEGYDPNCIDGWIVKFIPNLDEKLPKINDRLYDYNIPSEIIKCPLQLYIFGNFDHSIKYDCFLASGFYGMVQDKKTYRVKPVIGYAVVVDKEEEGPIDKKYKDMFIKKYFS